MPSLQQRAEHTLPIKSHTGVLFVAQNFDQSIRYWDRATRQVFMMINGRLTIAKIALILHMPIDVVGNICVTLAVNGLVTVTEELVYHMDISDLERSLAAIVDMDVFAERFYNRLFAVYPETAYLFKDTDWPKQRRNLMSTIGAVVSGVKSGAHMEGTIQNLGVKHASKGVRAEDYPKVGACLIATFHSELGIQFTDSMEQSWTEAYTWIAEVMQGGSAKVEVTTYTP